MGSFDNVTLLYSHPHVEIFVEDNTGYTDEEIDDSTKEFNGIQVGFFGSGRDNKLLYCRNTDEYLNEYGDPNYKLYGQAGYNAYNALAPGYAGMYIMRLMPVNATHSNTVIMAKYKLVDDTTINPPVIGNDVMELIGTNPIAEMIPDTDEAGSTAGATVFTLSGKVVSGLTGDTNVDGLFSHITADWLNGNNPGNFTIATVKIPVPTGVIVGTDVDITQTSAALKKFYSDFGEDPDHITANVDGVTATKKRTYAAEMVLEGNDYITLSFLVSEGDTVYLDINWGTDQESLIVKTTGVSFVNEIVEEEEEAPKKLGICYEAVSIENATSVDKLKAAIASLYTEDPDVDGFYKTPLMAFWSLGRGACGENIRIKFEDANEYDGATEPTTRMYKVSVMENLKKGLTEREYIYGMMDEDAFDTDFEDGPSMYLEELINDPEGGSAKIGMYFNPVVFNHMMELVNSTIEDDDDKVTVTSFDPVFGLNVDGSENQSIVLLDNSADAAYVNLVAPDGFVLANGNDGDLDTTTHTEEEIAATKEQLLIQAFEGSLDKRIKSRYTAPADFCLDANFSDNVKAAMGAFALGRKYDCMTYLDTKLMKTPSELIAYAKTLNKINGTNIVKEAHCYSYRDRLFTGKSCEMTITHWFAKAFVTHVMVYGIGEAFAREKARLTGGTDFISGSFYPVIDPDDNDIKQQLYKYSINCYDTVKFNVYQRSSAITSYQANSDRKDEFNEYITMKAIKIAHTLLSSKLYHIAEEEDRARFTKEAEKVLQVELSGLVKTCSVVFKMSNSDKKKCILRLVLRLSFKTVAKYGICEVYLDPRVVEEAA